ncbi:hypothetical protein [Nocardioides bizhenqiangii]|uniref:Uncharacterized protein n=1 Tax=Nocardioides bizhenqiangii TaxID=3095076 RepID=A0ABZ0ZV14_9ACTN|nr:hypothetical protein [Nocardioides sp. HM61]WQQ27661.1 hypothetical protein SHK19_05350 [Nocardioides sp. HM61]
MTSQQPESALPSPRRLIQLLRDSGWQQVSSRGDLYIRFRPPGDELGPRMRSLLVPLETEAPDFPELMRDAVDVLRNLPSDSAAFTLLSRLTTSPTDQFAFAKETAAPKGWIQWEEGETLVASARGLLVAGAKGARERLTYFGNKYGRFANRFLDEVMMGQTEVGSYVVRAYVPVNGAIPLRGRKDADEAALFGDTDAVASREVSRTIVESLSSATEAIDHYRTSNSLSAFKSPELALSYESVTAIKRIAQNSDYASITVTWEPDPAELQTYEQEFTFAASVVPVLERAANELVRPEPSRRVTASGTVHLLSRSDAGGPGVIGITTLSGQPANKLRVHLGQDDYHRALNAHDQGSVVQVAGDLEKEGNLSWLYHAQITGVIDAIQDQPGRDDPSSGLF